MRFWWYSIDKLRWEFDETITICTYEMNVRLRLPLVHTQTSCKFSHVYFLNTTPQHSLGCFVIFEYSSRSSSSLYFGFWFAIRQQLASSADILYNTCLLNILLSACALDVFYVRARKLPSFAAREAVEQNWNDFDEWWMRGRPKERAQTAKRVCHKVLVCCKV